MGRLFGRMIMRVGEFLSSMQIGIDCLMDKDGKSVQLEFRISDEDRLIT